MYEEIAKLQKEKISMQDEIIRLLEECLIIIKLKEINEDLEAKELTTNMQEKIIRLLETIKEIKIDEYLEEKELTASMQEKIIRLLEEGLITIEEIRKDLKL